jgi:hypothetical protein
MAQFQEDSKIIEKEKKEPDLIIPKKAPHKK